MHKEQPIDLDPEQLELLKQIIGLHVPNKTVWAYGSRVTWKAREASDLDLAIFDSNLTETSNLKDAFMESDLLISVDVMNWETIPDNFKENIKKRYVVLQRSSTPENWREVKLGDVVEIIGGGTPSTKRPEYWKGDIAWLTPPDFTNSRRWVHKTQKGITKLGLESSSARMIDAGDIVISARGTVGALAQLKKPMAFSQTSYGLRAKPELIDKNFLFYILKHNLRSLKQLSYGAVFDTITKSTFSEIGTLLPPLPEQKAIAEVLSSLDDKIDLLHCQNKTLENMAQALFRQWFVEEADDGWQTGKLGDIVEIFDNKRIPLSKMQRNKMKNGHLYPYYGAAQIMDHINEYIFDGEYILIAEDGTVKTDEGYPVLQYATGKFWVNNHAHVLRARKPYSNVFLLHFLLRLNIERWITGAVQPKINQANLISIDFPQYPHNLVYEFQDKVKPMFEKALRNKSRIYAVENLRDALLPKLMNGKTRLR